MLQIWGYLTGFGIGKRAPCCSMLPVWGPETVPPTLVWHAVVQLDVRSRGTSWELSPVHPISHGIADAALLIPYGLLEPGCPESSLCGCDLPSLHPPRWGSGKSIWVHFSKVLWVLVHAASIYFKSCCRNVTLYTQSQLNLSKILYLIRY